jgi:hypothetical protein
MFSKIALAAALIAGTASLAFAEDGSSSFDSNIYGAYAQTSRNVATPALKSRNAGLDNGSATATGGYDRASSPYSGGGF